MQLEIEREALRKETPIARHASAWSASSASSRELRDEANRLRAQWDQEKAAVAQHRQLREQIERVRLEMEKAQRRSTTSTRSPS